MEEINKNSTDKLNVFLNNFSQLSDRDEKIEYLLEISSRFKEVPTNIASRPFDKSHKVPACESDVYVWVKKNTGNIITLYFAVENPQGVSAKALAVILDEIYSGCAEDQIQLIPEDLVSRIFGDSISLVKGEGLRNMIRMIKNRVLTPKPN